MTVIARMLADKFPAGRSEIETLKQLGLFCTGLLLTLLTMTYSLDLSPGLF
jgi:hypothetical protein